MGRPKSPIIHFKKLFGGFETAFEVHRKHTWPNAFCTKCCDRDVRIQLSYAMSPSDLSAREPLLAAHLVSVSENGMLPEFSCKLGRLVWFWTEYACPAHQAQVEREAARLPSHIYVQIDRGPEKDKTIVGVPELAHG